MNSIESVERLNKLVRRLNPEQFVTVDVDSLVMTLQTPRRFNAQGAVIAIGISAWCWYGLYLAVLTVLSR